MRLICPNCGAQYEVPTEVIPETGRDVQCSDCGSTWFQHHPDHAPEDLVEEETAAPATDTAPSSDPPWQDDADDYGAEPDDAEHYAPDSYDSDSAEDDGDDASGEEEYFPAADHDDPPAEPKRREIDPAVADVLRQEAEREYRAREMDNRGTVETQQELGLQDTDNDAQRRSEEARARMARLRGEPEAQKTEAEVDDIDPSSRSNLLPDIDEINSSLDSDGKKEESRSVSPTQDVTAVPGKSGFRAGFRLAIVLAVLALVLYVFAPQLAEAVPQMAGLLSGYVDTVNGWRAGLNDLIQNMASSLSETDASGG
ncbi:hypothetical protein FIU85_12850 [Roseovarius sp. THAF8]|nr:hypothetical protein FIU85_12850 [Roseovarius sp. THAF8]